MDNANQAKALIILDDLKQLENLKQEFEKLRPNRLLLILSVVGLTFGMSMYIHYFVPSSDLTIPLLAVMGVCLTLSTLESMRTNARIEMYNYSIMPQLRYSDLTASPDRWPSTTRHLPLAFSASTLAILGCSAILDMTPAICG
jgi:hypothetical protein